MNDPSSTDEQRTRWAKGERQLTADLITAADGSDGPLSQERIDEILGVGPEGG